MNGIADLESDEEILDLIVRGSSAGSQEAIRTALRTNTDLVIWRDGKIVHISPKDFLAESGITVESFLG